MKIWKLKGFFSKIGFGRVRGEENGKVCWGPAVLGCDTMHSFSPGNYHKSTLPFPALSWVVAFDDVTNRQINLACVPITHMPHCTSSFLPLSFIAFFAFSPFPSGLILLSLLPLFSAFSPCSRKQREACPVETSPLWGPQAGGSGSLPESSGIYLPSGRWSSK